jgi:ferredoxin-NADP reductase
VELTIERLDDGEVSPYLTEVFSVGDPLELRGPIGGYFAWPADSSTPVLLVGGGSGVVPLMAMARSWITERSKAPMRLIYSTRSPDTLLYAGELAGIAARGDGLTADIVYTRSAPTGWAGRPGRLDATRLRDLAGPADPAGLVFVCGPTGFVESIARALTGLGYRPGQIRTERFGPSGG